MTGFRICTALSEIPATQWDALHDGGNPFLQHAFLAGLESTGSLRADWGWRPYHPTLWRDGELVAAAPGYLKDNSHGEFVFDHAWANAYARYGLDYYPKWLIGIPYSPVTGPRLLAADDSTRRLLLDEMISETTRNGWSSLHVNFLPESETGAFSRTGWPVAICSFTGATVAGRTLPDSWMPFNRRNAKTSGRNAPRSAKPATVSACSMATN